MIRIILSGCNGRMGKTVARLARENEDLEIVCGIDSFGGAQDSFSVFESFSDCDVSGDVIIDFSNASAVISLLDFAVKTKTPVVLATTGLNDEQKAALDAAKDQIAVFVASNMSLGINLLIDLVKKCTWVLGDGYDIEIVEKHHNQKLDAPSGTALTIADEINAAANNSKEYIYDRHSVRRKRGKQELGIHSVRGGTIVGEHSVIFAGTDEIIEIKHSALSRDVFAVGALRAAKFLAGKSAGLYGMNDMISD